MATKITPRKNKDTITVQTKQSPKNSVERGQKWWMAKSEKELCSTLLDTATFLKTQQQYKFRQANIYSRLYGGMPISNFVGSNLAKGGAAPNLPVDRPTYNVIQSCVDTLVSRVTMNNPRPVFLTDAGNSKERKLAKQMNTFINGELYQTKAYDLGKRIMADACTLGTGVIKVSRNADNRVALERILNTELFVDHNDGFYGAPRQMLQLRLVDREVAIDMFKGNAAALGRSEQAFFDDSSEGQKTITDQIMLAEAWRLPSSKDAGDGRHAIACSGGIIFDEEFKKPNFPFTFLHYSPRMIGFWAQGLVEQLMGTQVEINKLLMTMTQSMNMVGVPRVFVEDGSKVVKAHLNNMIGAIVTYRGTKPSYEVAPCVPQEMYAQLERLIQYAYQQSGISSLAASAQKPAGLNSGEAIRSYDDIQSDRFAIIEKRYDNFYTDLSYQIIDCAKDIAEQTGKYATVYPNKDGTQEIDLPNSKLLENTYVIQCFEASSLPRDPAGRLEKVVEMLQSGMVTPQEGRRLLDFPDISQVDKLETAAEERILTILDNIIDEGKYSPADPFMDLQLAKKLVTQYYNLYVMAKLDPKKAQLLRDFALSVDTMIMKSMPAPEAMLPVDPAAAAPMGVPQAPPVSDLMPIAPQ
jgi:hypothetical protein